MLSLLDIGRETEVPDDPISQGEHVLLVVIGSVRTFFFLGPAFSGPNTRRAINDKRPVFQACLGLVDNQ